VKDFLLTIFTITGRDAAALPLGVSIGLARQLLERRTVDCLQQLPSVSRFAVGKSTASKSTPASMRLETNEMFRARRSSFAITHAGANSHMRTGKRGASERKKSRLGGAQCAQ
jgi:hypothetical protein